MTGASRLRILRTVLLAVLAVWLLILVPRSTAGASDVSVRWESFSEASACGHPYTRTPEMSKTGLISATEPILGPFGTHFGRTTTQVRSHLVEWTVPGSGGVRVRVHEAALPAFQKVTAGLAAEAAAGRVYTVTRVSSFNSRTIAGVRQLSRHTLGLAIDINPHLNPQRSDGRLITNMPGWYVQVWRDAGFCWGGDWVESKDPMHFSWIGPVTDDSTPAWPANPPRTSARVFGSAATSLPTEFGKVLERYALGINDMTGDGAPDVVGLRSHPTGSVIDIASASRRFGVCSIERWHIPDTSLTGADHTLFIDVDGDSRQDLVTLDLGNPVTARIVTRSDGFDEVAAMSTGLPGGIVAVAGADLDAEHRAALWTVSGDGSLGVYGGQDWTEPLHSASLPSGAPKAMAVADRDGGGVPEVFALYTGGGGSRVEVLRLTGGAWAVEQTLTVGAADPISLGASDYDGDGRADIQVLDSTGRISVYLGNTPTGRPADSWFLSTSTRCSDPVPLYFEGTFFDDDTSVHRNGIEAIAAAGITVGCNPPFNDKFCPGGVLTRAQAATFMARALALPDPGRDFFEDDNGNILEGGINRVGGAGITTGCNPPTNTRFCPDRKMTRAEFATFLVRALGLPATDRDFFVDDTGHVLEGAINRLAAAGITKGCNPPANDRFCPQSLLTRAETATFMTRAGLTNS